MKERRKKTILVRVIADFVTAPYLLIKRSRPTWLSIILTRLLLCTVAGIFVYLQSKSSKLGDHLPILFLILAYLVLNGLLVLVPPQKLRAREMRFIPDFADIVFLTCLILLQEEPHSIWFLFFIFPIISASRYWGLRGSLALAGAAIIANAWLQIHFDGSSNSDWSDDWLSLILRCLCFVGVAVLGGNLTKHFALSDQKLLEILGGINREVFYGRSLNQNQVYQVILEKALEITNSKRGHIRRLAESGSEILASVGLEKGYEHHDLALSGYYSSIAVRKKDSVFVSDFSAKDLKERLGSYLPADYPRPRSALFVPLLARGHDSREVMAVIALYTRRRKHYTRADATRLENFAPILEIAEIVISENKAQIYRVLQDEANEKQNRLQMLHEVARQFEPGTLSPTTWQRVAEAVMNRLNSEEAAIFLWEKANNALVKQAEASPDKTITEELMKLEKAYHFGQSMTGECFETGEENFEDDVDPATDYAKEFGEILPSGTVRHIGLIPLAVGQKKLGVLRVINKRSASNGKDMEDKGFTDDDKDSLRTMAINVAIALNNKELLDEVDTRGRYLERVIDFSPYPIIVLDQKGTVKLFNHLCEAIWKVPAKDAIGRSVVEFYESEKEAKRVGKWLKASPKGRFEGEEAKIKDSTGKIITISLSANLITDENGKTVGSIGVFKDANEITNLEEKALESQRLRAIARVMGYIGHDVKTKLIANQLNLQRVGRGVDKNNPEMMMQALTDLDDSLTVVIGDLQNIALTNTFNLDPPQRELVYVERVFDECMIRFVRQAEYSRIKLALTEFPRNKYLILADVGQLRIVIENLYENSQVAFQTSNGLKREINIDVRFSESEVFIDWTDNGCGIPKSELGNVFKSWFTTKRFGNGLGLYWARTIMEKHDGSIVVDSEEGKWTRFSLSLPLSSQSSEMP